MSEYKGLVVPRISKITLGLPTDMECCAIPDKEGEAINIDGTLGSFDVCSDIECVDCIVSMGDNGSDTYIEFLVDYNYITKEEALDFVLSLKGTEN